VVDPSIPPITSFRDATGFALELADRYAFVSAAVLLGPGGTPIDIATAEGIDAGIEPVVAWAAGIDGWRPPPLVALVISVRSVDPDVVREADIRRYRQARWSRGSAGCHLVDWIETDGDLVRSYAYLTCPAEAWSADPPGHRMIDGGAP
jgi:hypothetical protein